MEAEKIAMAAVGGATSGDLWDKFGSALGDARMAQGKCPEAIQAYERATDASDEYDNGSWINLVLGYFRCGMRDKAWDMSERMLRHFQMLAPGAVPNDPASLQHLMPGKTHLCKNKFYCVPQESLSDARSILC